MNLLESRIDRMTGRFLAWARASQLKSYDWWDIWGTSFGRWAKTAYVRKNPLGYGGVALLTGIDLLAPGSRRLFVEQRTFPICHAQMATGYLNLWHATGEDAWLARARELVPPLLAMASPRARGLGWGMKHEWTTINGVIPSDTPCNTQTAYPYELFLGLLEATGEKEFAEYLDRIAFHVAGDFPEWREGDKLVCSYSTIDSARVVNANSYRMMMLADAGARTGNGMHLEKSLATMRYVLSMQRENGSWPYSEQQDFVDTYHTCFVLKNLRKTARALGAAADLAAGSPAGGSSGAAAARPLSAAASPVGGSPSVRTPAPAPAADAAIQAVAQIERAIGRGLGYFFTLHFDADGYPVPFSVAPRTTLHRYDAYDLAETIGLLAPMEKERERLAHLVEFAEERFQTGEGWFRYRLFPGELLKGIPYMRYANSAMFLALTVVKRQLTRTTTDHATDPHAPND